MGIITMIIIGLIAGAIARLLIPGRQHIGLLATIVVGIVGSYVGGALGSLVFPPHVFSVHPPGESPVPRLDRRCGDRAADLQYGPVASVNRPSAARPSSR